MFKSCLRHFSRCPDIVNLKFCLICFHAICDKSHSTCSNYKLHIDSTIELSEVEKVFRKKEEEEIKIIQEKYEKLFSFQILEKIKSTAELIGEAKEFVQFKNNLFSNTNISQNKNVFLGFDYQFIINMREDYLNENYSRKCEYDYACLYQLNRYLFTYLQNIANLIQNKKWKSSCKICMGLGINEFYLNFKSHCDKCGINHLKKIKNELFICLHCQVEENSSDKY
jgi:hypothetical protein